MNTLTVTLPDSLYSQFQRLAEQEGISVDQLAASALTEKIAALMSTDYLIKRAQRANRANFMQALSKVPDVDAEQQDIIPD